MIIGDRTVELAYNLDAAFTQWVVKEGHLREPFVVVDVGVQRGEHARWHQLRDYLIVHGFDPIQEAVDALREQNATRQNRHYHAIAAGAVDEERAFYFNPANPTASSMYAQGDSRFNTMEQQENRTVQVRRLDTLFAQGVLPRADFLKVDVEGFEQDVFHGARDLLAAGVLGVEAESNFHISPTYPKGHFATLHEILLQHRLLLLDIAFNRIPRASFQRALAHCSHRAISDEDSVGSPAKVDALFCRDAIDEEDCPGNYATPPQPLGLEQLMKLIIVYELHGLNDIALDTVERFAEHLEARLDIERAIRLLADPHCRPRPTRRFIRNARRSVRRRLRGW